MASASVDNLVKICRYNQYIGAFIASIGGFAFGISLGWNSKAGEILRNSLDATGTEIALIGGLLNAGTCLGAMMVPFVVRYFSRIRTMFLTMPVFVIGWLFICITEQEVAVFIIGRIICGICGGVFCILTPTYVAEIADKESRGRLLGVFQLLINCGIMYAFVIAHVVDEQQTVRRYNLICAPTCFAIALVSVLPESPLYYLSKNDEINAVKSLGWYRGDTRKIDEELAELKQLILATRSTKVSLKMITNRRVMRSFVASFIVMSSQQMCGVNTMIFYALTLFNAGGSGELTGSEQTLVVAAVQILSSILATVLVDVLGRRILLTISSTLMGLFLILLGWFYSLRDADPEYDDIYFWMPPTWIGLFFAAFNIGVGPISWSLLGDTFPAEIKLCASATAVTFNWLMSLVATLTFGEMIVALGITKLMSVFAGICWLGAILCAILVKDTRGKSLLEIQEDFGIDQAQPGIEES